MVNVIGLFGFPQPLQGWTVRGRNPGRHSGTRLPWAGFRKAVGLGDGGACGSYWDRLRWRAAGLQSGLRVPEGYWRSFEFLRMTVWRMGNAARSLAVGAVGAVGATGSYWELVGPTGTL